MYSHLLIQILFMFASTTFAANSVPKCEPLKGTVDLYNCILKNHPDVKYAQLSVEAAQAVGDKLTQFPNPDLSLKSVNGKNAGENVGGTEVSLSLNLTDLLIKRPSLGKFGRAEEKVLTVEAQEKDFQARSKVILDLYRYRQLLDELELVAEALETFNKIENQFRSRRAMGPEQEITLNLVELAQGDYELRKNHLVTEKTSIEVGLKGIFGSDFELKKEWLPVLRKTWPEISAGQVSIQTFELRKIEAEKERAEAEKSIANAESWPQLSAGPVYERATEGPNQYSSYGVNVTVGLPIFSQNGGGRTLAEKNLIKSQYAYDYAFKKADLEIQLLLQKYRTSIESLKRSANKDSLNKKHTRIDNLFRQGLTAGGTVIEAHRQISEFIESQHEHEIVALETLMYLNTLSNKDISEVLK